MPKPKTDSLCVLGYHVTTSDNWLSCIVNLDGEQYELTDINPSDCAPDSRQHWSISDIEIAIRYELWYRKQGAQHLGMFL